MKLMNSLYGGKISLLSILLLLSASVFRAEAQSLSYPQLKFFYNSTGQEIPEGWNPLEYWNVSVNPEYRQSLSGNLELPYRYKGKDQTGDLMDAPVIVIWDFAGTGISSVNIHGGIRVIASNSFGGCTKLKSIVIPGNVEQVGAYAFKGCTSLSSVVISSSKTKFTASFSGCDIKKGAYPTGNRAFVADIEIAYPEGCIPTSDGLIFNPDRSVFYFAPWMITELEFPATVTSIGDRALAGCTTLNKLTVKSKVPPTPGEAAFDGARIGSIVVPAGSRDAYVNDENWRQFSSIITEYEFPEEPVDPEPPSDKDLQVGSIFYDDADKMMQTALRVISIEDRTCEVARHGSLNTLTSGTYTVPATATANGVEYKVVGIGVNAYSWQFKLDELIVPDGITYIGSGAFRGCSALKAVSLPQSIKSLGDNAFEDCKALEYIPLHDNLSSIGEGTFRGCSSLVGISFSDNLRSIGKQAFQNCTSMWRAGVCGVVGDQAFAGCTALTTLDVHAEVDYIGSDAFKDCNVLTSVRVTDINKWFDIEFANEYANPLCFAGYLSNANSIKPIAKIKIPETIASLGNYCLYNYEGLTELTVPENVETIGKMAFANCSRLETLNLGKPASVDDSFIANCTNLKSIELQAVTPPACSAGAFTGFERAKCSLVIPEEAMQNYSENAEWTQFDFPHHGEQNKTEIILDSTEVTLQPAESVQLKASIINPPSADISLVWTSLDETVATVDPDGVIRAIRPGVTTVTVTSGSAMATCVVKVSDYEVTHIAIQPESATLEVGETLMLVARVSPQQAPFPILSWTSSDSSVVEIDEGTGYITAVGPGTAEIKAIYQKDADTQISGSCSITVKAKSITGISLNQNSLELAKGSTFQLTATLSPESAAGEPITWMSTNELVATVDNTGLVTAVGIGSASISAWCGSVFAKCEVTTYLQDISGDDEFEYTYKDNTLTYMLLDSEKKTVAVKRCDKVVTNLYIPSQTEFRGETYDVVSIAPEAFMNMEENVNSISSNIYPHWDIHIPDGVTDIGERAFKGRTKIGSIFFPNSIKNIGKDAFKYCKIFAVYFRTLETLCNIDFPNEYANPLNADFYNIGFPSVGINLYIISEDGSYKIFDGKINNIKKIGSYAFAGYYGKTIEIGESVESIGEGAFFNSRYLTDVKIEAPLTALPARMFAYCWYLSSIEMKDGLQSIGNQAFVVCKFKTFNMPNTVESIGNMAFNSCNYMESIKFSGALQSIGDNAFKGCRALTEVVLPPSVQSIGANAFDTKSTTMGLLPETQLTLKTIAMGPNVKTIGEKAFYNNNVNCKVYLTAQTPPICNSPLFYNLPELYVQGDDALLSYKSVESYSNDFKAFGLIGSEIERIEADKTSIVGKAGDNVQLEVSIYPSNVALPYIFWHSTNPKVATVDHNGLVTIHMDRESASDWTEDMHCSIIAESLYANAPRLTVPVYTDIQTSVNKIDADNSYATGLDGDGAIEVYDLQGTLIRTASSEDYRDNLAPGIYIIRRADEAEKIIIR